MSNMQLQSLPNQSLEAFQQILSRIKTRREIRQIPRADFDEILENLFVETQKKMDRGIVITGMVKTT